MQNTMFTRGGEKGSGIITFISLCQQKNLIFILSSITLYMILLEKRDLLSEKPGKPEIPYVAPNSDCTT